MTSFPGDQVACRADRGEIHRFNDLMMLVCGHRLCRLCIAQTSENQTLTCPICTTHIPCDDLHPVLSNPLDSCDNQQFQNHPNTRVEQSHSSNEGIKMKIIQTMDQCEKLLVKHGQSTRTFQIQRDESNELQQVLDERMKHFCTKLNQYRQELEDSLMTQQQANEINFMKHQLIDIQSVAASIEPRLNALRNQMNFLENVYVEQEIKRIDNEADRQLRLLKHKADTVPTLSPPIHQPSTNILGELLFQAVPAESIRSTSSVNPTLINASGDTSLQSIPPKLPMWTVTVQAAPYYLCLYPHGKSTLLFSCSSNGVLSLYTYLSPVTYDSPRYLRTCHLFADQPHVFIQSCAVFHRFILFHVYLHVKTARDRDFGTLFFFTHEAILEHEPVPLSTPVRQYLADENRLWAIDSLKQSIFSQVQPTCAEEILTVLSHRDHFASFDPSDSFLPFRMSVNQQSLAVLAKDLQQVFIYNKITRERIFKSQFGAGHEMNIWNTALFPRDNSLLLKFDWTREKKVQYSVFIHFNTKNQSIGRIEGKYCMGFAVGPNKEIIVGFNLKTGVIRCYT